MISMSATLVHALPSAGSSLPANTYVEREDPFLFKRARTWWTLAAICLMSDGNGFFSMQDNRYYQGAVTQRYSSDPGLLLITIATWVICAGLMVGHIAPTLRT